MRRRRRRKKKSLLEPLAGSRMRAMMQPLITKKTSTPKEPKGRRKGKAKPVWKTTTAAAAKARRTCMLLSLVVVFIRIGIREELAPHVNIAFAGIVAWLWAEAKTQG